jgi:hypothetical protein
MKIIEVVFTDNKTKFEAIIARREIDIGLLTDCGKLR